MKIFIVSAIFFLLVRWSFGNRIVRSQWLEYVGDIVLMFGLIAFFLWDKQKRN